MLSTEIGRRPWPFWRLRTASGSHVEVFTGCTLAAAALVNTHLLLSAVLALASGGISPCLALGVGPDRAGADTIPDQPIQAF